MTESASSSSSSPPNFSAESLNGLKFGRKIYFEDGGLGALHKSSSGSAAGSSSAGATPPKKQRGGGNLGQPPRCQVEGCEVDLSGAQAYHSRHKVCGLHSKTPTVIVAGLEQRFCQQCSRSIKFSNFIAGYFIYLFAEEPQLHITFCSFKFLKNYNPWCLLLWALMGALRFIELYHLTYYSSQINYDS
ncbi:hypothetical protein EV2_009190 [Malus domestica]